LEKYETHIINKVDQLWDSILTNPL
jgi:hypothetical protein